MRALLFTEGNRIVLIHRVKPVREYYVFPGGGVEAGESPEEALIRECGEELGVTVAVANHVFTYTGLDGTCQEFYRASVVGGTLGEGSGPEFHSPEYASKGSYSLVAIEFPRLKDLNLMPPEIADALLYLTPSQLFEGDGPVPVSEQVP